MFMRKSMKKFTARSDKLGCKKAVTIALANPCTTYTTPGELHASILTSVAIFLRGAHMNRSE